MYIVSFKVKKTNRSGQYMFTSIDEAHAQEKRLKADNGLKSVKLQTIKV